jgi:hypothetical protein
VAEPEILLFKLAAAGLCFHGYQQVYAEVLQQILLPSALDAHGSLTAQ